VISIVSPSDTFMYVDSAGRKLRVSALRFFVSHIKLVGNDNSLTEVDSVELIDFANPLFMSFNYTNLKGDYKGIQFGCGVDSLQNLDDPSLVPVNSPLSNTLNTENMYWGMGGLNYRFEVFEGYWDTGAITSFLQLQRFYAYHIGLNSNYRHSQVNESFSICCGNTTTATVYLDIDKIFYGKTEQINLSTEGGTQTTDSIGRTLAPIFADNFSQAFNGK
jgi:hypothetical protein